MALKSDLYIFPLINKFRDAFAESFKFASRDGLELTEVVRSNSADGAEVVFSVRNWKYTTPNTWCGVPFNSPMIDTIRGSRNTYTCTFTSSHPSDTEYNYTVTCRTLKNEEAPEIPDPDEDDPNAEIESVDNGVAVQSVSKTKTTRRTRKAVAA